VRHRITMLNLKTHETFAVYFRTWTTVCVFLLAG